MGKRGPSPKPTAILKLHGSTIPRRRASRGAEPLPGVGLPDVPEFLNGDDQRIYQAVTAKLVKTPGLLTVLDGPMLERYARYYSRWKQVERELERFNENISTKLCDRESRQAMRLLWNESRMMDAALKQIEDCYGMSPKARIGLIVQGSTQQPSLVSSTRKRS